MKGLNIFKQKSIEKLRIDETNQDNVKVIIKPVFLYEDKIYITSGIKIMTISDFEESDCFPFDDGEPIETMLYTGNEKSKDILELLKVNLNTNHVIDLSPKPTNVSRGSVTDKPAINIDKNNENTGIEMVNKDEFGVGPIEQISDDELFKKFEGLSKKGDYYLYKDKPIEEWNANAVNDGREPETKEKYFEEEIKNIDEQLNETQKGGYDSSKPFSIKRNITFSKRSRNPKKSKNANKKHHKKTKRNRNK